MNNELIVRPQEDRVISGVCAALANYMDVDVRVFRIATVIGAVLSGFWPLPILYFVAAVVIPKEQDVLEAQY